MASPDEVVLRAVRDPDRGRRNLSALGSHLGPDRAAELVPVLGRLLPRTADPDMALNNLERLLAQPAARDQLPPLIENRGRGLEAVLHLLATSQFFADTLATYPEFLDSVRTPPRKHPSTAELTARLRAEVEAAGDEPAVLRAFRRFRHRHSLRVGINDIVRDRPLEEVTRELARVADASIEVALQHSLKAAARVCDFPTVGTVGQRLESLFAAVRKGSGRMASDLIGDAARIVGGGGGRNPELAMAGGKDPTRLDEALDDVRTKLRPT